MAEWLYEDGIGESRAALIADGTILEAAIEIADESLRPGAIIAGRLGPPMPHGGVRVRLDDDGEALLAHVPKGLSEGARLLVELTRAPIAERGHAKLAQARIAPEGAYAMPGPTLRERIAASGPPVRTLARHEPDALEAAGWSELLEQAADGVIAFPGGLLRMALTPAMTLFDVDGILPPAPLAIAGASAAGAAIRRLDIAGSIGIDLPTLASKADRQAAAAALDATLPQPFERTAVNGFGFLQIIRRKTRASLPEQIAADPAGHAARALLRSAERAPGAGRRTIVAHPGIIALLAKRPDWIAALEAAAGASVTLRADPAIAISSGHVAAENP